MLLELGVPGKPAPYMSGEPFHRCTHTALSPKGEIYVSDGYGNARVHKYSPDGKLLLSWGEPGTDPGQFNIAHNIVTDAEGWVYVADRENHRVQVFDGNGKYETQWINMHRPCGLYCCRRAEAAVHHRRARAGHAGQPQHAQHRAAPVHRRRQGQAASRASAARPARAWRPGKFIAPHGLAVDSRGDIYVGEVSYTEFPKAFPDRPIPWRMRSLQKLEKLNRISACAAARPAEILRGNRSMDRGIWAIWYDIAPADRAAYEDWFHNVHIPEKLARPGYLWAAHYALGHGGRGTGYLALFGAGEHPHFS